MRTASLTLVAMEIAVSMRAWQRAWQISQRITLSQFLRYKIYQDEKGAKKKGKGRERQGKERVGKLLVALPK